MLINQRLYENIRTLRLARPNGTCGLCFTAEAMTVVNGRFVAVKWKADLDGKSFVSSDEVFATETLSDVEPGVFDRDLEIRLETFEGFWFAAMEQIEARQHG